MFARAHERVCVFVCVFLFVLQKLWFYRYPHEEVKMQPERKKNNK